MKFLLALFFVGLASASFVDILDDAADDLVAEFLVGMEDAPSLKQVMGYDLGEAADTIENDIKTELGKSLKQTLDDVVAQIRLTIEHGKEVSRELVEKAKQIAEKLKELGHDVGDKTKEIVERMKQKAKEWIRNLMEKLGFGKRGLLDHFTNLIAQLDFKNIFEKLKEKLLEKVDITTLIIYIQRIFGHEDGVKAALIEIAKEKGIDALKRLIIKLLPDGDGNYSISDAWQSIKDFFNNLGAQIRDKFRVFADWLKTTVNTGIDKAKDKAAKLRLIAKEVLEHSKTLSKEAAREALEFFRPHKEDLGVLWDELKETVRRVVTGSDGF